jgi:ribonuclease HI
MKHVTIYTDGSCLGNPGPGGYAAILKCEAHSIELSGSVAATTNNRMELQAIIEGLGAIKKPCAITVYCDSKYAIGAFTGAKAKANQDLVKLGVMALQRVEQMGCAVQFVHVNGHAGDVLNEQCDKLAQAAAQKAKAEAAAG